MNVKNHIRQGKEVDVVGFHKEALKQVGFIEEEDLIIETPGMGFGKNRNARVRGEHVFKFRKPINLMEEGNNESTP